MNKFNYSATQILKLSTNKYQSGVVIMIKKWLMSKHKLIKSIKLVFPLNKV